jgi:zinc transport system substrate-binding protein
MLRIGFCVPGLLVLAGGCGSEAPRVGTGPLTVAVSLAPHAGLVKRIGGDLVEVITVIAPGESPHTYQPTDYQVSQVLNASCYLRAGVPFENGPWFQALSAAQRVPIVDVREGIELVSRGSPAGDESHGPGCCDHHGHDPHIWLSPQLLKRQARTIAETLTDLAPQHAEVFAEGLAEVQAELDELHRVLEQKLQPLRGRAFFVFHPAWGYFADDYGLRQIAVEVDGKEPTDHQLTELQQIARREQPKMIFVQPQIAGGSATAMAEVTGVTVEVVDPLAENVTAELARFADLLVQSSHTDSSG